MAEDAQKQLRAYVEYFRDLGVYDFYRRGEPGCGVACEVVAVADKAVQDAAPVVAVAAPVVAERKVVAAPVDC